MTSRTFFAKNVSTFMSSLFFKVLRVILTATVATFFINFANMFLMSIIAVLIHEIFAAVFTFNSLSSYTRISISDTAAIATFDWAKVSMFVDFLVSFFAADTIILKSKQFLWRFYCVEVVGVMENTY